MRYALEFLDELRRRVGLVELIGRRIKLQRRGREYAGLCPFHQERTPSFYVIEDEGFFHCFGCGAHGDAIGFVMRAEHVDFRAAVARLAAAAATGPRRVECALPSGNQVAVELREKDERNRRIAWRLWARGRDPRGTLVEKYLGSRGLSLPPAPVLRFAPRCFNREIDDDRLPAMLARVDGADGEFVAVHRTWLTPDGRKAELRDPKMSLGPISGGAVRLTPAAPVLAIAEGIENALTAIAAGYAAWSAVSAGGIPNVMLPRLVEDVVVVADNDANGVGQRAAQRGAARWRAERRRVRIALTAREGEDLNDMLVSNIGGDCERTGAKG